jgi:hypothetical protein
MGGLDLKEQVQPISEKAEADIIKSIIAELRTGLALNLDTSPDLDRKVPVEAGGAVASNKVDYLVIGRAGAVAMVAAALARAGKTSEQVSHPDWRLTSSYVSRIAEEAKAAIEARRPGVVIVAGLDESYFMASYDEVHTLPATKDLEGHYHIHGDLVVASKEAQLKLAALMEPLWAITKGVKTVVVGPVVRYVTGGCCGDPDHMPNRNNDTFLDRMRTDVLAARNTLKEQLRLAGHHHCRIIDMAIDMVGKKNEAIWTTDPTMPSDTIFDSMVAALPGQEARIDLSKKRTASRAGPEPKRIKLASEAAATRGAASGVVAGGSTGARGRGERPQQERGGGGGGRRTRIRGGRGRGGGGGGGAGRGRGSGAPYDYNQVEAANWWHGDWYSGGRRGSWRGFGGGEGGHFGGGWGGDRGRGGGRGWR